MQDDRRAELLSRLLDSHEHMPEDLDDQELAALAKLGADLEQQAANLAFIRQAEAEFEPAFSRTLREKLLAEHPGSVGAPRLAAVPPQAVTPAAGRGFFATRSRTRAYRALLLPFLAAALIITTVNAFMHPSSSPRLATGVAATSTHTSATAAKAMSALAPSTVAPTFKKHAPAVHVFASRQSTPTPNAGDHLTVSGQGFAPGGHVTVTAQPHAAGSTSGAPRPTSPAWTPQGPANTARAAGTAVVPHASTFGVHSPGPAVPSAPVKLPSKLPALPARADVYTLHYAQFSQADIARIAASFPGLRKAGPGVYQSPDGPDVLTFAGAAPNRVMYKGAGISTPTGAPVPAGDASATAKQWLAAHHLLPSGADLTRARSNYSAAARTVAFSPELPRGLTTSDSPGGISVELDAKGAVIAANVTWPVLGQGRSQPLLSPQQALAASGDIGQAQALSTHAATSGTAFVVDTIDLIYGSDDVGGTLAWRPFYRLSGHLKTPGGASSPLESSIPATAIGS